MAIVRSEPKASCVAALSVIAPPVFIVTAPVKVFVVPLPVPDKDNVPLVPPPTVVVVPTLKVNAPTVKEVASPIFKDPVIARLSAVVAATVDPLRIKLPPIEVIPLAKTLVPEPESVTLPG